MTVTGVGNGADSTRRIAKYPVTVIDREGRSHNMTFETPILSESGVACFMGHRSLRQHRAVPDMVNQELMILWSGGRPPDDSSWLLDASSQFFPECPLDSAHRRV